MGLFKRRGEEPAPAGPELPRRRFLTALAAVAGAGLAKLTGTPRAEANTGDPMQLGMSNIAQNPTMLQGAGSGDAALTVSNTTVGDGVIGFSPGPPASQGVGILGGGGGGGVIGASPTSTGILGLAGMQVPVTPTPTAFGIYGRSAVSAGVVGQSETTGPGLMGVSGLDATTADSTANAGVYGKSVTSAGVIGVGVAGPGLLGLSGLEHTSVTATAAVGVFGKSDTDSGVVGKSDAKEGVLGHSVSGTGILGLAGVAPTQVSVTAVGVYGASAAGAGVRAETRGPGPALEVVGAARFSTGGTGTILSGKKSVSVANPAVTNRSLVAVTLNGNPGTAVLKWVKRTPGAGFTVYMSAAVSAAVPFSYLIFEPA